MKRGRDRKLWIPTAANREWKIHDDLSHLDLHRDTDTHTNGAIRRCLYTVVRDFAPQHKRTCGVHTHIESRRYTDIDTYADRQICVPT